MTAMRSMDKELQAAIVVALQELERDPSFVNIGGKEWLESRAVVSLKKAGYDIFRLKGKDINLVRIFYFVDEKTHQVLVKEIVPRGSDVETYKSGAHIHRIKQNYLDYFHGR